MWPIVVCNPTFLDRILAYGSLIAMSQCLIFRVRLKEAQTMNKEHHASAPLCLAATAIRNQHPRATHWSSALHNKDREDSSVMAAQTKWWMSTKKSLYLRIPFQFDNPYTRLRFEHQRTIPDSICPNQCTFLSSSPNVLPSSPSNSRSPYSSQFCKSARYRCRLSVTEQDHDE